MKFKVGLKITLEKKSLGAMASSLGTISQNPFSEKAT